MAEFEALSDEDRLAGHILEEDCSLENRNKVVNSFMKEKVSHYRCSWAYGGDPLVMVWEHTDDYSPENGTPDRAPDKIGCMECGNMTPVDDVQNGEDIWEAREYVQKGRYTPAD